jgi:hypothetical protein
MQVYTAPAACPTHKSHPTRQHKTAGAECYVSLRTHWHRHITTLAPSMAYSINDVDPVGSDPESTDARQEFRGGLRSVR